MKQAQIIRPEGGRRIQEGPMAMDHWRPYGTAMERWEPFRHIGDVQGEINRLFDSFFGRSSTIASGERMWAPLADMHETKDDLLVTFELPGVREKEVSVSITGDVLEIRLPKAEEMRPKEIKIDIL